MRLAPITVCLRHRFNESEEGFYIYKDDDLYKVSVELGETDKVENGFEIYMD